MNKGLQIRRKSMFGRSHEIDSTKKPKEARKIREKMKNEIVKFTRVDEFQARRKN